MRASTGIKSEDFWKISLLTKKLQGDLTRVSAIERKNNVLLNTMND